jgi:hypothetical protein
LLNQILRRFLTPRHLRAKASRSFRAKDGICLDHPLEHDPEKSCSIKAIGSQTDRTCRIAI